METTPVPTPEPPVRVPTLKEEWITIVVVGAIVSACLTADFITFPKETAQGKNTPLDIVGGLIGMVGHAMWISMDRKRRGLEVGRWRFGTILIGPFAIAIYLAMEYKLRALYLIPVIGLVYLAVLVPPTIALLVAGPLH